MLKFLKRDICCTHGKGGTYEWAHLTVKAKKIINNRSLKANKILKKTTKKLTRKRKWVYIN